MKVLHILGSIERSGAETMLRDAVGRFRELGVEVELLSTGRTPGRLAPAFESLGVRVHHIPFSKSPHFFRELQTLVRIGHYDAVHVHTERAALWVEFAVRAAGVKRVIRSVHSAFAFSGWLRLRRAFGRCIAAKVLGVRHVFVSPSVERNEVERFRTAGVRVLNAIDTGRFVPVADAETRDRIREELGIGPHRTVVTSVGSCTDLKQHDHVIEAVALVLVEVPELQYVHVGDGPNREAERALCVSHGVEGHCVFLGERDDVVHILQATDILVMPSRYEGLPIAAVEASACGLPIIAYDVPGLRDAVVGEETGVLVATEPAALAQAILRLVVDPDARVAFGRAGRSMVEDLYDLDDWVTQHVALYQDEVSP